MKLSFHMPRGLTVLAVTALAASQVGSALAQYNQYGNSYQAYPQQQYVAQPQYVAMQQPSNNVPPQAPLEVPQGGYKSHVTNSCATGGCVAAQCGNVSYASCAPRRHWFGGVYGLLMDRVSCDDSPLAFTTDTPGVGYYPANDEYVLNYADIDNEIQGGAEFRFGATFAAHAGRGGYGGCDPCCGTGCGTLAWEAAYWGLVTDDTTATVFDISGDGNRTYTMRDDYREWEYSYGGVWRPVGHGYDFAPPVEDHATGYPSDVEIRTVTARSSFSAQNVELNLLRLPLVGGGYNGGCDSCASGGCDMGGCGGGCGSCGPRCQVTTLVGARYVRFDDDFYFRSDVEHYAGGAAIDSGYFAHNVETDNQLVGFQFGANGIYLLGCSGRFALHCSTNAGIYANHIEAYQRMDSTYQVRHDGTLSAFNFTRDDDCVAFLGELRAGASYQCTCNCRVYAGYRAMGATGIALAVDQSSSWYAAADTGGSIFLHGLQSGIEFSY